MHKYFSRDFIRKEYNIPKILLMRKFVKYLFTAPVEILTYLLTTFYIRLFKLNLKIHHSKWEVSGTTKGAIYENV